MDLQKVMDKLNALNGSLTDLGKSLSAKAEENALISVGGRVSTLEAHMQQVRDMLGKVQDMIRGQAGNVIPGLGDDVEKNGGINFMKVVRGLPTFDPNSRDFDLVKEYNVKKRDMSASSDSGGGVLIPVQLLPGYIELARARTVIWKESGLTQLDNLVGAPVEIPTETTAVTAQAVAENQAPSSSDSGLGQITCTPRRIACLTKLSQRLLRLGPMAQTIVQRSMTRSLGLELDRVIINGVGGANEARGIANYPGINTVAIGTNGGDFTFGVAQNQVYMLEKSNTYAGTLKFVGHPGCFYKMKRERIAQFSGDTGGLYVLLPMSDQNLRDYLGYDFLKTTQIPSNLTKGSGTNLSMVVFGNWEDLYLALWQDIEFRASDVTGDSSGSALTQNQLWILSQLEYDVQLARALSFCLTSDANTQ